MPTRQQRRKTEEIEEAVEIETRDPDLTGVFGLYRFYSIRDDRLGVPAGARLYVGLTYRTFLERWEEEQRQEPTQWWWYLIDWTLTETVVLNGGREMRQRDALVIEESAIRELDEVRGVYGTLANSMHNGMAGQEFVARIRAAQLGSSAARPPAAASGPPPGEAVMAYAEAAVAVVVLLALVAALLVVL